MSTPELRVLRLVASGQADSVTGVAAALGISMAAASRYVRDLIASGHLERVGKCRDWARKLRAAKGAA